MVRWMLGRNHLEIPVHVREERQVRLKNDG